MSAEESALLRSVVALVRQRYGLDEIEATIYIVEMPNRIKALEAENAALRARAVPEVVWQDLTPKLGGRAESTVKSGEFTLVIYRWEDERAYSIRVDGTAIRGSIPEVVSLADCKAACEAAFLRLVGAGS